MKPKKQKTFIFPETYNVLLTAENLENVLGEVPTKKNLTTMTSNTILGIWLDEAIEETRFHQCDKCNKIHSRTFESCDGDSEFSKFYKAPVTVWQY